MAATDIAGADVLAKRIRELAARCTELVSNSVSNISCETIEIARDESVPQAEAERIVEQITTLIVSRTVQATRKGEGNVL